MGSATMMLDEQLKRNDDDDDNHEWKKIHFLMLH